MADTNLSTQIINLATRVGTECKSLSGKIGTLTNLSTTEKTSLVTALNEIQSAVSTLQTTVARKTEINDSVTSTTTAYSSSKVDAEIISAKQAVKSDLLGGAGEAYDTLKELADLISENQDAITALQTIANNHVKFNEAQSLTDTQKSTARSNIGACTVSEASAAVESRLSAVESKATTNASDISTLKTAVGDTTADFKSIFEKALA